VIVEHVTELIGNTPLLRLPACLHGREDVELYAKLELLNPFGSVKDRIAWGMLRDHLDGIRAEKRTLIESSSGNTAKALQLIAGTYGLRLRTVTNRIKVTEMREVLQLAGADIEELPGPSDCPDPDDPEDPLQQIERELAGGGNRYFHTAQYVNEDNVRAHFRTGAEIASELPFVDVFVGGLGTTGSSRGVIERLRQTNPGLRGVGVVAANGDHIPGIRTAEELREVGLYRPELYDAIDTVSAAEAIDWMLRLVREAGVPAGPTSGASLAAAVRVAVTLPEARERPHAVVIIACDRVEGYLSYLRQRRPDIFDGRPPRGDGFQRFELAPEVAVPSVTSAALPALLEGDRALVVDTRGRLAFASGHIQGAVNIQTELFERMLVAGSPFSPASIVVVVCPHGDRSRRHAAYLCGRGIDARSLEGGMTAWREAGLPLTRIGPPPRE
jgi:cysteine synthase/rhodanese-related sulfurtransferase